MEGPSSDPVPGRRGTAGHWIARIGIGIVPILTIGLLGWVPALVAAIRTRRTVDRVLVAVSIAAAIAGVAMMASFDASDDDARKAAGQAVRSESSPLDDIGVMILIVLMVAMPVHWFVRAARWPQLMQGKEAPPYVPLHARWPFQQDLAQYHGPLPPATPATTQHAARRIPPPPPPTRPPGTPAPIATAPRSTPPPGSTPPAPDDPAARARARLQGLSERLREQDGGNSGGSR